MKIWHFLLLISFPFLNSCKVKSFKYTDISKSEVVYLNLKFHNNKKLDSVFYYLHLDLEGNEPISKYYTELVHQIKTENDKDFIFHFLYSLEIYNAVVRDQRNDLVKPNLSRNDFFKNIAFKKDYYYNEGTYTVHLENINGLVNYNFGNKVIFNDSGKHVSLEFPPTNCKITFTSKFYYSQLYDQKFGNLIASQQ